MYASLELLGNDRNKYKVCLQEEVPRHGMIYYGSMQSTNDWVPG